MESPYKIEKNVKLPQINVEYGIFPFEKMEKGDSFFVPISDFKEMYSVQQLRGYVYRLTKQFVRFTGKQYVFYISAKKQDKGVRVFRIN